MHIRKIRFTQESIQNMVGADHIKKGKKIPKGWQLVIQGLPLAAAATTVFLPLQRLGQQFVMLIVLIWVQVFLIVEVFLAGS
jgi:hypothetical protein